MLSLVSVSISESAWSVDATETETAPSWASEVQSVRAFLKVFDVTETETALSWTSEVQLS